MLTRQSVVAAEERPQSRGPPLRQGLRETGGDLLDLVGARTLEDPALETPTSKAATVDDDGQALEQLHRLPGPGLWWWRRHPRILTGDLGRSLRSVGAIGTAPDTT
ncbi:hypothetical protein [Streptomyces sp. MA15]|uniref:hypothetical protein n=1 Tax=unclassified Streptomyces TaxID=2593676 RepID=UPI0025B0B51B|nr:hypothetical protein [Streptomyces sp. MA15]MDN3267175.1 hypothetical protein [Streptomyces sp. MA15]